MAKTLNIAATEFPEPFAKLKRLSELMQSRKGYRVSTRKLAVVAISRGADILIAEIETEAQSAKAG